MSPALEIGSTAPDFVYLTVRGQERHLAELWAEGAALVVWLRHFG